MSSNRLSSEQLRSIIEKINENPDLITDDDESLLLWVEVSTLPHFQPYRDGDYWKQVARVLDKKYETSISRQSELTDYDRELLDFIMTKEPPRKDLHGMRTRERGLEVMYEGNDSVNTFMEHIVRQVADSNRLLHAGMDRIFGHLSALTEQLKHISKK